MASNDERDLTEGIVVELHGSPSIVGRGKAFHILDGMGEDRDVPPSSEHNVHDDQGTVPDVA
jgi:hypothetical protein